jgi:hypothetical protein
MDIILIYSESTQLNLLLSLENRIGALASQLDDKETFPLHGRPVTSDIGLAIPLILYLKEMNVEHFGVLHWNDEFGNSFSRAVSQVATEYYPDLKIVTVSFPFLDATQEDYLNAVKTLAKSEYRWFYYVGSNIALESILIMAHEEGIVGTGEHVWILNGGSFNNWIENTNPPKNSPLAKAMKGLATFPNVFGKPGMETFDNFSQRWKSLDNPSDQDYIESLRPQYNGAVDGGFELIPQAGVVYSLDPAIIASIIFDTTVLLGLSACAGAEKYYQENDEGIFLDGKEMFAEMLSTSFQGASGNITLDPETGSRLPETALYQVLNSVETAINETHVGFTLQGSHFFDNGLWTETTPFIYNDGTTNPPPSIPPFQYDYNYIGSALRIAGICLASCIILLSAILGIWTWRNSDVRIVRSSQPIFLFLICLGTGILACSIIFLSIDDGVASDRVCSVICMVTPWSISVGFVLVFAALFAKTWRINRIFHHKKMRRVKVTARDVMAPLVCLMTVNIVVLIIWTTVSPLEWVRKAGAEDRFGRVVESSGGCTSDDSLPFLIILATINISALLLASYQSYKARNISTEFSESEYIFRVVLLMIVVAGIGIPTTILVWDDPRARYFALSSVIFTVCASTLGFIFVPKLMYQSSDRSSGGMAVRSVRHFQERQGLQGSSQNVIVDVEESGECSASTSMSDGDGIKIYDSKADNDRLRNENAQLKLRVKELSEVEIDLKAKISELSRRVTDLGGQIEDTDVTSSELTEPNGEADL